MKRTITITLAGALATALMLSVAWTQEAAPGGAAKPAAVVRPNAAAGPMQLKLKHTQKVLEGVALEDFDAIAKNAEMLGLLTQDENWQIFQTVEYRQRSADFQRIANELAKAAKQKNIDEATLAYLELTMCCVNCHKHTRSLASGAGK